MSLGPGIPQPSPLLPTEPLRTQVASFAVPSHWRLQTEPLPLNHAGKVDKAALIAQARAEGMQEHAQVGA
jgi:hypothetical protein